MTHPLTREGIAAALRACGVGAGDVLMLHVGWEACTAAGAAPPAPETVLDAAADVLGEAGTLVMPAYTFSFCRREPFDPAASPAVAGPWNPAVEVAEALRARPGARRSRDPIHSVVARGPRAAALVDDVPPTCFGAGSVFARLRALDAAIALVGLPLEEATFRHHVEEDVGVPFRFHKLFTGTIREDGVARRTGWVYHVRLLADAARPTGRALEARARAAGTCRAAPLGTGEVLAVRADAYAALTERALREDPWCTAEGPPGDPVRLEARRVGAPRPCAELAPGASMRETIDALWRLPRDIVSDGYDAALDALATQLPMTIHAYPTGTAAWTWIVPEKWTCHAARLETLDGRRLLDRADHPLHVVSYSLPFEGEVSRAELLMHLHVHPRLPDALPFVFKYYERDWGLCCTRELAASLTDERYRVAIRADFSYGELKVGEVVVEGETDESIVLCAHLCHPAMVNDDLTGVAVGMDVMRALLTGPRPRFTWRFLIVPETIGSIAHLSRHEALIPRLRGGLFLEMLGREHPHALQASFAGDTPVDRALALALAEGDPAGRVVPFRTLAGNDERQFNAPGVRVPMLALTRQLPPSHPDFPYREYHSSHDTPDRVPPGSLEASRDLVLRMAHVLEHDRVPVPRFRGEPFGSRYGLHVDAATDPAGHRALYDVCFLVDGTRSVAGIAAACGIPFDSALGILEQLRGHGLVAWA